MAEHDFHIDAVRRDAGLTILALTDSVGFDAFAAGWLHDFVSGAWRYLLVTPMLTSRGPGWVYEHLLRLFRHNPLPEGITPLDIYVIDPDMELAAFGVPFLDTDDRRHPAGPTIMVAHGIQIQDFLIEDGFVAFYRRMPPQERLRRRDPARRFDARIRQLDRAA